MERKTAITTAAALTLTFLAGGAAIMANAGILAQSPDDPLGELSPIAEVEAAPSTTTAPAPGVPEVQTIVIDEYVSDGRTPSAPAAGESSTPTTLGSSAPPTTSGSSVPGVPADPSAPTTIPSSGSGGTYSGGDDDHYEHDGDDESEEVEHEDEYEGHDDDD